MTTTPQKVYQFQTAKPTPTPTPETADPAIEAATRIVLGLRSALGKMPNGAKKITDEAIDVMARDISEAYAPLLNELSRLRIAVQEYQIDGENLNSLRAELARLTEENKRLTNLLHDPAP